MPVTVKVNGVANSLVHKGSNAISVATIPDVCKTPSPAGPVPIPYPNISQSATLDKGTTTVKADGGMMIATKGSEFSLSNGDNAGVAGGVKSSTFMKESTWILYSFDVKIDGSNACRLTDKKFQNHENTADLSGVIVKPNNLSYMDSILWDRCTKQHVKYKKLQSQQAEITDRPTYKRFKKLLLTLRTGTKYTGPAHIPIKFASMLEERIELAKSHLKERNTYIDMGCDKLPWNNNDPAERERKHRGHVDVIGKEIGNLHKEVQALWKL